MDCAEIVRAYEASDYKNVTSLMLGSPGPETLKDCKDILTKATQTLLVSKSVLLLEGDLCSMHSVQLVQDGICALGKTHICAPPCLSDVSPTGCL